MHQNDITPSVKPKKAIHKHPNKHRKVRSGLQSVFQSQNHQVCDASKRHHPFCYSKESNPQTSEQTSEGQIRSPKRVQSQNYQVCDASKRHHPFCWAKESNPQTSEQTSEGQIRSPKCFSITELSGLWCIKTTSPLLLSQRKQSTNPNKHRKVRSGLQSVFQSQNYQVCDASKRHHPFC